MPKTFIPFISNYLCRLVLKIIRSYCELHNSPSGFFLRFKVLGMPPLTAQAASLGSTSSNGLICDHIAVWYHTPNTFYFCYIIFNLFSIACSYVEPYGLSLLTKLALPTLFMHFLHSSKHGHFWLQKITYYRAMKLTLRLMSS